VVFGELAVLEVDDLGDGEFEATCEVFLTVELDLNNEEWESETMEAIFDITLWIGAGGEVTDHYLRAARHPDM